MDTTRLPETAQGIIICMPFFEHVQPLYKTLYVMPKKSGAVKVQVKWRPFDLVQEVYLSAADLINLRQIPQQWIEAVFWVAVCKALAAEVKANYAGGEADKKAIMQALELAQAKMAPALPASN